MSERRNLTPKEHFWEQMGMALANATVKGKELDTTQALINCLNELGKEVFGDKS